MRHADQVALTRRIFDWMDRAVPPMVEEIGYNPVSAYTDAEQFERERAILFRDYPLLVGFSRQLREPGDYLVDDFSPVPILALRGRDGAVRAFANVCRHRGARVAEGAGCRRTFSCPYHGWTYNGDGALVGVPDAQGFAGVDRGERSLRPLPAVEKYGLVWVLPEPGGEAFAIDDYLDGLGPDLAEYHFEDYHHYETRVLRRPMNWKIALDTFGESYHFQVLHPKTVSPLLHHNLSPFQAFGRNHRLTFVRKNIDVLRDRPEAEWDLIHHAATVYLLFPNTVLTIQNDHIDVFRIYPRGDRIDATQMYMDFYVPEAPSSEKAVRHWDKNVDLLMTTVETEDFRVGEGIQQNLASGAQRDFVYGRFEPALDHYHRNVRRALGLTAPAARAQGVGR